MKIGFSTLLFCVFLTLKLCDVIDWSWWWVTAPLWIDLILSLILGVCKAFAEEYRRKSQPTIWDRLNEVKEQQEELIRKQNRK